MEKKKSTKANLEKTRSSFLFIVLILVTTMLIFAFNWKTLDSVSNEWGVTLIPSEDPPIKPTVPEPIHKKNDDKAVVKEVIKDVIKVFDDSTKLKNNTVITVDYDSIDIVDPVIIQVEPILTHSEIKPKFPGGELALRKFVAYNVIYPAIARENGIEGTVYLRFEVTKSGKVGKIEILNKNQDALLIESATDVIKKLPRFKPGMQNGQKVNVWYSIPISFKLK